MKCFLSLALMLSTGPALAWKLTPVASGFELPVDAEPVPEGGWFVVEQAGKIKHWKAGKAKLILDLTKRVYFGGECGLLGLALHPEFKKNGRYYINYTARTPELHTYLSEFTRGKTAERVLMKFRQPYTNHKGGQVVFDKKGYLYIGVGDGGLAGDPLRAGQDTKQILGKILRIDVDKGSPYGVPDDNPFAKGGGLKEIYAWGMRNPWRFSFDPQTGDLFAADVGQDAWEEIDVVEKGKNYGWSVREGKHCYRPSKECPTSGLVDPIWEYGHDQGQSITGGFVYRGKKHAALQGAYVYGDYVAGTIWALHLDSSRRKAVKNEVLLSSGVGISSFGLDENGEILVLDHQGGRLLRLD